jgi:glycosyltransferase involved in cell wall biosynthesis
MDSKPNLTIATVIARLNIGGAASQAILMTEALREKGYRSILLTGEVPASEGSMEYLALDRNIIPIKIGTMSRSVSWHKDLTTLWQLIRILYREKPDVIHTHTAKAGTLGRLAAIATGVPVRVHTFHGHVFRGYFSPFVTRIFLCIERFLARHTDCIIAVSDLQKRELAQVYRIAPADKILALPLGFDLAPFLAVNERVGVLRNSLGCGTDTFLVGWVGRLTAIKDPSLLLHCARHLSTRSRDLRFAVIGDGELRKHCEEQIAAAALGHTVSLAGWQQHLDRIYADVDLVVLTSINEGTPVALLEAMASGKAFVSTDVGGVRDLMVGPSIKQGSFEVFENGILAPRDGKVLADAVAILMDNPETRRAMGQAGRNFVKAHFSSQRLADDLESLYLSLGRSKQNLPLGAESLSSGNRVEPGRSPAEKQFS